MVGEEFNASEKLAIESGSADENIEIMKAYMCKQRIQTFTDCITPIFMRR